MTIRRIRVVFYLDDRIAEESALIRDIDRIQRSARRLRTEHLRRLLLMGWRVEKGKVSTALAEEEGTISRGTDRNTEESGRFRSAGDSAGFSSSSVSDNGLSYGIGDNEKNATTTGVLEKRRISEGGSQRSANDLVGTTSVGSNGSNTHGDLYEKLF